VVVEAVYILSYASAGAVIETQGGVRSVSPSL
jgi:hypothetical protein